MKHFLISITLLIFLFGCQTGEEDTAITIAAAASLSDAMKEVNAMYLEKHPESDLSLHLASSGVLANQIKQGAPIDVFLSASEKHFKEVEKENFIDPDYQTDLLTNKLVLIASEDASVRSWDDLLSTNINRITIGMPKTVPAGAYAKEALTSLQLWSKLEEKFVFGKDVRQVLTYVETGNADAGLVYETDFRTSSKVTLVDEAPEDSYSPIVYPSGVIDGASDEAKAYFAFLQSDEAITIFEKYGFQRKK
ncbi:molybdate ABC transporter substrate-binding protein [Pseudalkalibacillus hwajinpoensis]|uniref:molybdate ABC transporter substrate-binding protein n=1 Tax=Guptibacillus hwajinpoensis TaxID=208199 RepID=UPI00325A59BE